MLTHLSILLILAGAVTRGLWGEKGSIALREGEKNPRSLVTARIHMSFGLKGAGPVPRRLRVERPQCATKSTWTLPISGTF